jgi:hypothetical protein
MPYVAGGPGREGEYDPSAIARWAVGNGLGDQTTLRRTAMRAEVAELARELEAKAGANAISRAMSRAVIPACIGLLDQALVPDARTALNVYGTITLVLVAVHDELCGAAMQYALQPPYSAVADGKRHELEKAIAECFASMLAKRCVQTSAPGPAAAPPAS